MNSESITTTALALQEYIHDFPQSEFALQATKDREEVGSHQFRSNLHNFSIEIEAAATLAVTQCPNFFENLQENVGCWDFEVIPKIADQEYDRWARVKREEICRNLLALANPFKTFGVKVIYSRHLEIHAKTYEEAVLLARAKVVSSPDADDFDYAEPFKTI